ncbi:uncharacterized protein VTP21DRAFT_3420 [Calcarisporiella thermophila]|uniref:uncharacterized protein n=1 Tax=Calcarisporiella thermophila TaxID=911321 RepID=UPI00374485DA
MSHHHLVLKITNVIFYLFFLGTGVYDLSTGSTPDVIERHASFFAPADWVQYAWILTYILLGGFVVYEFFEGGHETAIHGVGWFFPVAVLLNTVWFDTWKYGWGLLSWFSILIVAGFISFIYHNLTKNHPITGWADALFVHAPFSLWHGWVVFFAVVNTFATFTHLKDEPSTLDIILVILGLLFLTSTAVGYAEYKRGDVAGALVIAWGLYAVFARQTNPVIHWASLAAAIISTLYPAKPYVLKLLGRRTEEQAPLLG